MAASQCGQGYEQADPSAGLARIASRACLFETLVAGSGVAGRSFVSGFHLRYFALVGADNSVTSCDLHVFVDEAAEPVSS